MKDFDWQTSTVTHMHIELSNHCNAACPMCPRFVDSTAKVRPDLNLASITRQQFEKWFPPKFMRNMERILFCGTHGDPLMTKDIIEITDYIQKTSPNCTLLFHTNGGMRNAKFWESFGNQLVSKNTQHRVVFSIDGLEDTNHLYRRNVDWTKLMENVKAFLSTGAVARWEFLVFGHNEHQVEEAKKLSSELGFADIEIKRALGFDSAKNGELNAKGVYDRDGNLEYIIDPPTDPNFLNTRDTQRVNRTVEPKKDLGYLAEVKKGYHPHVESKVEKFVESELPPWNQYLKQYENMEIKCKSCVPNSVKKSEIYVSCNGIVFPCCFVGTRVDSSINLYEDTQLRVHIRKFGVDKFNLEKTSIYEIMNNGYLDQVYTSSWNKEKFADGKLSYCAMTCGSNSEIDRIYSND